MKEINGHKGYYLDREGNCYSRWVNKGKNGLVLEGEPKKLVGSKTKAGYTLIGFGRKNRRYLHQLMLENFVSPRPQGMVACHKDDNPSNNHIENLYWGTPKQNLADRRKNSHLNDGVHHGLSKLTEENVLYIRSQRKVKTQKELAEQFDVHPNTIYYAQKNFTYKNVMEVVE